VRGFIVGTVVTAIALYVLVEFVTGFVTYEGEPLGLLVIAAIFGVINGLIGPIVRTLALPLTFMTMGLVGFVINAGLLLATAFVSDAAGFDFAVGGFPPDLTADTILAAIVGAVVLSAISTVVRLVLPD
jgi:putative membrane protein